jgi:hypothetical protein
MKRLCLLLAPALLLGASSASANVVTGTVTVVMKNFFGLQKNGSPKPSANRLCRAKFGNYAGPARTTYKIDPQTLFMSAQTTFHGQTYALHPLGLAGQYAFGYFQPPSPIYAVRFSLNLQFKNPVSAVVFSLDGDTNCLLTNTTVKAVPPTW